MNDYDCALVDQVFLDRGADIVPFSSEDYGWVGLPDDLELDTVISFPTGGAIWEYSSKSTKRKFVLWWWDFESSTLPDGTRGGNHHFCGMYETTRKPKTAV